MAKDYTVQVTINGKDNASPVFEKFSGAVAGYLKIATTAAITAAAAFGAMSMKWGMDFEQQMSAVQAVSQATAVEMGALSEKAKQLGRDSAFSATEAGQAMGELIKAGLSVGDTLNAVGSTLDLASAGEIGLADAARIAAQALNVFKLPASEVSHEADVLAQAAVSSATGVAEIGEALS
jgi:TP901 family phage tail tape measure protein